MDLRCPNCKKRLFTVTEYKDGKTYLTCLECFDSIFELSVEQIKKLEG